MKITLALAQARPMSRSEAWGCLTANLALPGSGSLAAGRAVGYFQMAVYLFGFVISIIGWVALIRWYLANPDQAKQSTIDDPFAGLEATWRMGRLAVLGIAMFVFALSWAIVTSLQILKANPKDPVPPRIQ
ncbi:MAG: hypothetical protein ABSA47_17675 [Verrucomicrobiota bacterium]|jgi:H+/gluconate symporter-like permease